MKSSLSPLARAAVVGAAGLMFASPLAEAQTQLTPSITAPAPKASDSEPILADRIVAIVNNEVITRNELRAREEEVKRGLARQGTTLPPQEVFDRQVLERLINERAELQEASDSGIKVDDTTVDRTIGRLADENKLSLSGFRQRVEADGTPFSKFRDEVRNEIILTRLREREVDNNIQVSEGEVDNFIAEKTGGHEGQELDLAQILVRVRDQATSDEIDKASQKANEVYAQLQSGADFNKLAVSYSDAPEALNGGDLGWRDQDRYPQLFVDAVQGLAPGQVAKPVKSPNGFHILKLVGKRSTIVGKNNIAPVLQTHVRHILLRVNEVMSAEQARARLMDIRGRILAGTATFEDMAKSYSADGSAARGGDLGTVYPGDTVPEFEKAMNALQPGEISEPVQTPYGLHLIQVVDRKTGSMGNDKLRLLARQALRDRKSEEAFDDWARSLRDRAYVEVHLDER